MFRMRRYRVFVLFAALTVFAFYRFGNPRNWEQPAHYGEALKEHLTLRGKSQTTREKQQQEILRPNPPAPIQIANPGEDGKSGVSTKVTPPPVADITKPVQQAPPPAKITSAAKKGGKLFEGTAENEEKGEGRVRVLPHPPKDDAMKPILEQGSGRWEGDQLPLDAPLVRWEKPVEHFPIPKDSIIQLPTGKLKPMPKIQAEARKETVEQLKDRHKKRAVVVEAFRHAWGGYKSKAWGKDELMPVSGEWKNPFSGWGATLVDSLDTLWMMGLMTEFHEAVEFVKELDFKSSRRGDIPIFETTIRYLGGLLGAYDVSEGNYKILLEKAVELAEIMMGAFDTPNRMPDTFYQWKPTFASQAHRANTRVVLAELGSLAVEFTRLAQLTKEPKYYDAIARITDGLQEWQNHTRLPGMWPTYVDASGCERVMYKAPDLSYQTDGSSTLQKLDWKGNPISELPPNVGFSNSKGPAPPLDYHPAPNAPSKMETKGRIKGWDENHPEKEQNMEPIIRPPPLVFDAKDAKRTKTTMKSKRQFDENTLKEEAPTVQVPDILIAHKPITTTESSVPECIPHGLASQSNWGNEEFTLGSLSDSTYEYLPKQHILLGGLVDKYREMYEKSIDVAKEYLLFRAMIPNEKREILVSGTYSVGIPSNPDAPITAKLEHEGSHLTCFAGGMFAMGAKLFDRKEDLDIAAKLTDGCVWAYETTTTGIMPERFNVVACDDRLDCKWNESKWWDEIDPNSHWRIESYDREMELYTSQLAEQKVAEKTKTPSTKTALSQAVKTEEAVSESKLKSPSNLEKRQLDDALGGKIAERISNAAKSKAQEALASTSTTKEPEPAWTPPTSTYDDVPPALYSPEKPISHEKYAKQLIEEDRLPPGMKSLPDRRYILRPEALESVFYMHRITGSPYWRQKGWAMITSILKHTKTELAHAAIDDVTKSAPGHEDSMESFWLAETLKYAYLLMDDDETWSLDDWVLNTEAHLLRRPDYTEKGGRR